MARRFLFAGLLATVAAAAGCYSPNPESGTLFCSSDRRCPESYVCRSDLKCWQQMPGDPYVGHWAFAAGSSYTVDCTDGFHMVNPLDSSNTVDLTYPAPGTMGADLVVDYYCPWKLKVEASGQTSIVAGQSCSAPDNAGNVFLYTGQSFNFTTLDGKTATLTASLKAASSPPCTVAVSGTLKNTP